MLAHGKTHLAHGKTRVHPDSGVDSGVDFGVESENAIIYNTEWASDPEMLLFTIQNGPLIQKCYYLQYRMGLFTIQNRPLIRKCYYLQYRMASVSEKNAGTWEDTPGTWEDTGPS